MNDGRALAPLHGYQVAAARRHALLLTISASAFFAFWLPSSVGGVISRPLSMVSIAGTCALFVVMLLMSSRMAPRLNIAVGASIMLLLGLFTITSPFEQISPGVILIYGAQALLFMLDLRHVTSRHVERACQLLTALAIVLGYALAFDVGAADRLVIGWYSAFYRELLGNMVTLLDKPVLTFATHSMAGFMIYMLFYVQFTTWRVRGGRTALAAALALVGLLVLLRSTTGMAYAVIAVAQLGFVVMRAFVRHSALGVVAAALVAALGLMASGFDAAAQVDRVQEAVLGDRIRGLTARYAGDGLLAGNFAYLSDSPLAPIGVSASESLYLGDSGIVVNMLRGSVFLVVAAYLGLWLFLTTNLTDRRSAAWLWWATLLFEIGFTPMQYFRFVAFVPLLVVTLNTVNDRFRPARRLAATG